MVFFEGLFLLLHFHLYRNTFFQISKSNNNNVFPFAIDFGCGSGILAVAALKLGATKVTGIDIDYQAIDASKANAQRNGVENQLALYLAKDQPENLKADILVANILAGPLKELAPLIAEKVKSGGQLALSGLLQERSLEVADFYAQWFDMDEPAHKDEWTRLTGIRK